MRTEPIRLWGLHLPSCVVAETSAVPGRDGEGRRLSEAAMDV